MASIECNSIFYVRLVHSFMKIIKSHLIKGYGKVFIAM